MNMRVKINPAQWPELKHITRELQQARLDAGMSTEDVARDLGTTASYIENLEECAANPSIQMLIAYSRLLKVPMASLFPDQVLSPFRTREGHALQ